MSESDTCTRISLAEVPIYLQNGEFYRSLPTVNCVEEAAISVPANALKNDTQVRNGEELLHLLTSLRYWMVAEIPPSLAEFCMSERNFPAVQQLSVDFPILCHVLAVLNAPHNSARLNIAASLGEVEILKSLLQDMQQNKRYTDTLHLCDTAAAHGHFECLKLAHEAGCKISTQTAVSAATNGHIKCLEYAHEQGCVLTKECCYRAAAGGHLSCLQYLHTHNCAWDSSVCTAAAAHNHIHCVVYLRTHDCPWSATTTRECAAAGHLCVLQYLCHNNCPVDALACAGAAHYGHLHVLQYLHESNCPWDARTCTEAAFSGHIQCLEYAHTNGCVWNNSAVLSAAVQGHVACVQYLLQHNCPCDVSVYHEVDGSSSGGMNVEQCLALLTRAGYGADVRACSTCVAGQDSVGRACTHIAEGTHSTCGNSKAATTAPVSATSLNTGSTAGATAADNSVESYTAAVVSAIVLLGWTLLWLV